MTYPPIQQEQNPEPYRPEGMPKLEVGMRVRWRISPECPYKCDKCGTDFHGPMQCAECADATDGVITAIKTSFGDMTHRRWLGSDCDGGTVFNRTHPYFIELHDVWDTCRGFWAAASELQVLGPDEETT